MQDKKDINIQIGNRIKKAREAAGLTQDRFAELIEMGPKNISAIERGAVGISLTSLQKICKVLSISSDSILFDSNVKRDSGFLLARLDQLSPKQFAIVTDIINKLFEALAAGDQ